MAPVHDRATVRSRAGLYRSDAYRRAQDCTADRVVACLLWCGARVYMISAHELQQRSAGVRIASGRAVKGICGINFSVTSYAWLMCVCACCSVCSAVPPPVFVRAKNAADALCAVPYPPLA